MKFVCTLIAVADIARSRDFYERVLGQQVKFDFGENVTFHGDFAIHLASHYQQLIGGRNIHPGGNAFELYFEDDDLEPIAEKLAEYGSTFVHGIMEQPWRQRVMRFYDPDGHIIEIGESMEYLAFRLHQSGLSHEEIGMATTLPEAFIVMALEKYCDKLPKQDN